MEGKQVQGHKSVSRSVTVGTKTVGTGEENKRASFANWILNLQQNLKRNQHY